MEADKAKIFSAIADLRSDMLKLSKSIKGLCDELQKSEILIGLNMLVSQRSASMYEIIDEIILSRGDWIASREIRSAYARKTGRRLAESTLRHYLNSAPKRPLDYLVHFYCNLISFVIF